MEKRVTGIYFAVLLIGIIFAALAAASFHVNMSSRTEAGGVEAWEDTMELTQEGQVYYYRRTLPTENMNEKVIIYYTVHMCLEVFIDGNKVYELKPEPGGMIKTTGFCWNTIYLTDDDAGKEIVLQVTPVYSDSKPNGSLFYGSYREIEQKILSQRIMQFLLAIIIALAGIFMLLYGFIVVKKGQDAQILIQFAIFAMMLGFWSLEETQLLNWIFPSNLLLASLSHLLLMTLTIPFMLFLRQIYHNKENKLWGICCYMNCAVMAVRVFLQIIGVYDLRETLLLTHICILVLVVVCVGMTIREVVKNELTLQVKVNSVGVIVILICVVSELLVYRSGHRSIPVGSIGFLFYITVVGMLNVHRSRELMEQARTSAIYRQLAYTDELTGLANRTAFREDLEKRMTPDRASGREHILPTVVFMFDLNDLKKCNDTYGHDYGDQYIRMAADALKKIFAEEGKCYRIGGDEFCAWTPYVSVDEINKKLDLLEQEVKELNDKGFVVTVSVAVGYAIYEEGTDGSGLYSTMKRADTMMYEKKQDYKKHMQKG